MGVSRGPGRPGKFGPETRERAVRLVLENAGRFRNETEALKHVCGQFGMHKETLRRWVREARVQLGEAEPVMDWKDHKIAELEKDKAELEQTIEILKAATFFLRAGVRPASAALCEFIEAHKDRYGVAPICRALKAHYEVKIAPRTFYAWRNRGPSKRALWDTALTEILAGYYEPDEHGRKRPESLYGSRKMWAHLNREGIEVARCTVERLMQANGWRGVTRSKKVRTTVPDPAAGRAPDLVERQFRVGAPNRLWVADFTYVTRLRGRWCYTAFVVDAFAGLIAGWQVGAQATGQFVVDAFDDAVDLRARQGHPLPPNAIHHSDAGSQYTAVTFGERLLELGILPSIGTVGDAYDNALAETTIGLYKTECVPEGSPFNPDGFDTVEQVELGTADWVHWYNTRRLMHRLNRRPPAEVEAQYYAEQQAGQPAETT
ncbi:MAG TPA: IS3 family transposase [Pseudonocardiaceae bacterium]|nr:IS3 family transposase [Pseudonocardiaceae bacterium]